MNQKFLILNFVALTSLLGGCNYYKTASTTARLNLSMQAFAASPERYIAERHQLEVLTDESELQKSWESMVAFCGTIHCELISSSITTRAGDSVPSGDISLRVAPADLEKLLANVGKLGKIAQHKTEREDKTTTVIDTDAKIKNLTSLRDSLRTMLAKPTASVRDLAEIQKQLTDTQSELDSENSQRKRLANETERIEVEISFRLERLSRNAGGFSQISNAVRESGSILADSTASLITTIVAVIPWLILIVPAVWLLAKAWRKLRRNRIPNPSTAPSGS